MKNILKFVYLFALIIIVIGFCVFYTPNGLESSSSSMHVFTSKVLPTLENYRGGIGAKTVETRFDKHVAISKRVVVPIHQKVLPNGVIRYSIPLSIGNTHIEGMLDTGSPGIRILPGTAHQGDFTPTNQTANIHYGSGVLLKGVIARASVTIGEIRSGAPINITAVEKITCDSHHPHCAASKVSQQDYRIGGGVTGKGFKAIVGVDIGARDKVNNPLPELGVHEWIIVLPRPGNKQPGALILNPDKMDLMGYTFFKLDTTSNPRDGIPSSITNLRTNKQVNGPAMLDTGAPGIHVVTKERKRQRIRFKIGDKVRISFTSEHGNLPPMTFTNNAHGAAHIKVSPPKSHQPDNGVFAGILPYFKYSVLYDSDHEVIGLKPRNR